jgi:hypothetical protein
MGNYSQSFGRHGVTSDVELDVPREVFKVDGVVLVNQNVGERDLGDKPIDLACIVAFVNYFNLYNGHKNNF